MLKIKRLFLIVFLVTITTTSLAVNLNNSLTEIYSVGSVNKIGSGFFINRNGVLLTSSDIVKGKTKFDVITFDQTKVKAEIIALDIKKKIAFLKTNQLSNSFIHPEEDAGIPELNKDVSIAFTGKGLNKSKTAKFVKYYKNGDLKVDTNIEKIASGSPIINENQKLLGLYFQRTINNGVYNIAIPIYKIQQSIKDYNIDLSSSEQLSLSENSSLKLENKTPYLRFHGSNTIGAQLLPELVKSYLKEEDADNIKILSTKDSEKIITFNLEDEEKYIEIKAHGSSTSFKGLKAEACEIGMASRPIKDKEAISLADFGDMRSFESEHILGLDGIAVIINPSIPLKQLDIETIARTFSGEITDWQELTPDYKGKINIYSRDKHSGTFDTFKSLVLNYKVKRKLSETAKKYESNAKLSEAVNNDRFAIGFCGLPYINKNSALIVSPEKNSDGLYPSVFTVATEDYVLSRRLFLYTPYKAVNDNVNEFIEFALSDKGQKIVEENGFVSQKIILEEPLSSSKTSKNYLNAIKNKLRLSVNFRFKTGSIELDNKALRDIKRVIKFLSKPENRYKDISLLGFADNVGSETINLSLSKKRAESVVTYLKRWGVDISDTIGLGEEMPVASNQTKAGRKKNRRVEIYISAS